MSDDTEPDVPQAAPRGAWRGSSTTVRFLAPAVVVAVVLGAVALGLTLTSPDATASTHPAVTCSSTTAKLTVQGMGQATVSPDLLTVVVDVDASGPSATEAMASDNVKVTGAVAAFEGGGVAGKDIQTSGLSLQPQYAYPKSGPIVTGYAVTNSVTATLRDVNKAGAVIDAVVGAAGNAVQINSISFSVAHPSSTEDLARSRAVTQAVSHAKAMATAAARALGPVCSLTDQTQSTALPSLNQRDFSEAVGSAAPVPAVPIETGSQTDSAQITLVYALEPLPTRG